MHTKKSYITDKNASTVICEHAKHIGLEAKNSEDSFVYKINNLISLKFEKTFCFASEHGLLSPAKEGYKVSRNESYGHYEIQVSTGQYGRGFHVLITMFNDTKHTLVLDASFQPVDFIELKKPQSFEVKPQVKAIEKIPETFIPKPFDKDKVYAGGSDLGICEKW